MARRKLVDPFAPVEQREPTPPSGRRLAAPKVGPKPAKRSAPAQSRKPSDEQTRHDADAQPVRLNVILDAGRHQSLRVLAAQRRTTVSALIRDQIDQLLKEDK